MSFKLTKDERATRDEISKALATAAEGLTAAAEEFNEAVLQARTEMEAAVATYNEALQKMRDFATDIATQAEEDIGNKSDNWQEGERGQAATAYMEAWQEIANADELEIEYPDPLEVEEPTHYDDLDQAPEGLDL